jgi:hypothetical protein
MVPSSPSTSLARVMEGFSSWASEGILPNKPTLMRVKSNTTARNPMRNTFQNILTARVIVGCFVNRNCTRDFTSCKNHALYQIKPGTATKVFLIIFSRQFFRRPAGFAGLFRYFNRFPLKGGKVNTLRMKKKNIGIRTRLEAH